MKKRTLLVVAVLTAISLLAVLAYAETTQENGYDLFKNVLKADQEEKSGTVTGSLEVIDNGETLFAVDGNITGSKEEMSMSGQTVLSLPGFEKEITFYGTEETLYVLDGSDVYVGTHPEIDENQYSKHHGRKTDGEKDFDEKSEAVMDALIGDLALEFEAVADEDGTTDLRFELEKDEVPALVNLLVSMDDEGKHSRMDEDHDMMDLSEYPLFNELQNIKEVHPELSENIVVEYLNVYLDLDEYDVQGVTVNLVVSGDDEDGNAHRVEVNGSFEFSDETTVTPIDLDGKTVYTLPEHE